MHSHPNSRKRGFTLVELLVVIGIIALLISILLPALNRAREQAMLIQCASNLRQFGIADAEYINESRGWHMPAFWNTYNYNREWPGLLPFRKTLGMPIIPSGSNAPLNGNTIYCYCEAKWACPKALRGGATGAPAIYVPLHNLAVVPLNYSYGMNVEGVDDGKGTTASTTSAEELAAYDPADFPQCSTDLDKNIGSTQLQDAHPYPIGSFHGFRVNQVKHPSEKLFIADAQWIAINEDGAGIADYPNENYDKTGETGSGGTGNAANRTTSWRHLKKANVLFFDGHVESLRHDQLTSRDSSGKIIGNDKLWKVGL
ncbi:MAG TPA: prepilin-type N-terminal cleavage/methylation domain-containing protein [Tepidisphaeraceae bacterium]|nr:prepilin-type N-terminal cleavage/methylation domain-containing protein [Tepidisphaeraceae bacterium]